MATYRAYVYCEECDRPLRENEYRSETAGSGEHRGTTYYCRLCNSTARKPFSMAGWIGIALLTCGMPAIGAWIIDMSPVDDVGVDSGNYYGYEVTLTLMAAPLAFFILGWWKKSKCKPIYDRWVMQHGINPDKWPELPQAPARTTTAQSLGRTTSAQSLGRSLGRSLGWLLFGHPILFWSLLIGAALAIIYSGSWKAEVTAPKMQLPTIQMDTIHPFDL